MFQKGANLTSKFTYIDNEIIEESGDDIFLLYTLNTLFQSEFTLIEEEPKEIDIQGIEKITIRPYQGFSDVCEYIEGKANEILEAVKQLDRKINNKEE